MLPSSQIAQSLKEYADTYGETDWTESDWAVVLGAGLVATILDIVLVGTPESIEAPRQSDTRAHRSRSG